MCLSLLRELVARGDRIKEEIWNSDLSGLAIDHAADILGTLHAHLQVQHALQTTFKLLQENPSDKPLPDQRATRVKHLLRFTFERLEPPSRVRQSRQQVLRELDCTSLKLCGLTYTVGELMDLPRPQFNVLATKISEFAENRKLALLLCREDVNKHVEHIQSDFKPEKEDMYKEFMHAHLDLRLSQNKVCQGSAAAAVPPGDAASPTMPGFQPRPDKSPSMKRQRLELSEQSEDINHPPLMQQSGGALPMFVYSQAPADDETLETLGSMLPDAVRSSRQWQLERARPDNGNNETSCISLSIPEEGSSDVSITLWVDQRQGMAINERLRLKPVWVLGQLL